MTKKAAPPSDADADVQTSADTQPPAPSPETNDTGDAPQVRGRALIDLPAHGLKCGEFGELPGTAAAARAAAGEFDLAAAAEQ